MRQQIHLDGSLRPMPSPGLARTDRREGAPAQKFYYPEFLSLKGGVGQVRDCSG